MILVVDIGGTEIKYAYYNNEVMENHGKFMGSTLTCFDDLIKELSKLVNDKVTGIAISSPGIIDASKGEIKAIVAYPFMQTNVVEKLEAYFHVPVTIENDGKCAGLAEVWMGNAIDCKDCIVVVLGTGVGGAIIKDQKIHHGKHLLAGEISTIKVGDKEWSDLVSTKSLCNIVASHLGIESINGKEIFDLYRKQNPIVTSVLKKYYKDIAIQLYNFQYFFDPDRILIGGGISEEPLLLEGIKEAIMDMSSNELVVPEVDVCKLRNGANLYGALYHYFQKNGMKLSN